MKLPIHCIALAIKLVFLCQVLSAQFTYTVSTLLPEDSHLLDDGLCLDAQGHLYGSYWGIWQGAAGRHVLHYAPDGTHDTLAVGFERPNGLACTNNGVVVADSGNNRLVRIAPDGTRTVIANVPGVSDVLAVPGTDSLIATSWGQNRVYGIGPDGTVSTISTSSLYNGSVGTAFDTLGRLYIANFNNGRIMRLTQGELEMFADIGGGIGFITYADGAILATNHISKKIFRLPINGVGVEVIAGSGTADIVDGVGLEASFRSPNGIAATPSGDTIYVSEFEAKALRMIVRTPEVVNNTPETAPISRPLAYPLPTSSWLYLENLDLQRVARAVISDASGAIVKQVSKEELQHAKIDCQRLPQGMYLLSILDAQEQLYFHTRLPIIR